MTAQRRDQGQAAVEFAIALPLVVLLVVGIVQVASVVADQLAVELAAREGARAAAVSADAAASASAAAQRATSLGPLDVSAVDGDSTVAVTVRYTSTTDAPLLGLVIPDIELAATVTMAREPP